MKYTSMYILNALMHCVDLEILNLYVKMFVIKLLLRWALQLKANCIYYLFHMSKLSKTFLMHINHCIV